MKSTRSTVNASNHDAGGLTFAGVLCAIALLLGGCDRGASDDVAVPDAPVSASEPPAPLTTAPAPERIATPGADPQALQSILRLVAMNRLEEARESIAAYRAQYPDDPKAIYLEAMTYHRAGDYAKAEPLFAEALVLDPSDATIHHFIGWARYYRGDLEGARASFEAHLVADPNEPDSHYGLALIDMQEGEFDRSEERLFHAIELIREMARSDPEAFRRRRADLGKCKARLGEIAFERGEYELARQAFENAIHDDPNQYTAYNFLSQIYRRLGDDAKADEFETQYRAFVEARGG